MNGAVAGGVLSLTQRSAPWRGTGRSIHALSLISSHQAVGAERI